MPSPGQDLGSSGSPLTFVRKKLELRRAGARPHLEWFHVSLLTDFYTKAAFRLTRAQNRDRIPSAFGAVSSQRRTAGERFQRINALTYHIDESMVFSLAIRPTLGQVRYEGSLRRHFCAEKTVHKKTRCLIVHLWPKSGPCHWPSSLGWPGPCLGLDHPRLRGSQDRL